jgi:hypothetical protein
MWGVPCNAYTYFDGAQHEREVVVVSPLIPFTVSPPKGVRISHQRWIINSACHIRQILHFVQDDRSARLEEDGPLKSQNVHKIVPDWKYDATSLTLTSAAKLP